MLFEVVFNIAGGFFDRYDVWAIGGQKKDKNTSFPESINNWLYMMNRTVIKHSYGV